MTTHNHTAVYISNLMKSVIISWAIEYNINQSSISKLLLAIREAIPILSLPLDPRTLLKITKSAKVRIDLLMIIRKICVREFYLLSEKYKVYN